MSVAQSFEDYKLWVNANPKIFKVDNDHIVCESIAVGAKAIEITTAQNKASVSVQVVKNTISLEGFLAWSVQVCGC